MDPALLREREQFKKRALAVPVIEKRKNKEKDNDKSRPSKRPKVADKPPKEFDFRKASGSSQYKFGILAKIVKFMMKRHQVGDTFDLTLDEILDETNQLDVNVRIKHWLATEALNNNPKIEVVEGDRYKYRPKYNFKDKKTLLKFLDKQDQRGLGGILIDDVEEALPKCDKALKALGDHITYVHRPIDKKKVLFYNDKSLNFKVDEELQKLWRSSTVEGMDERKIEEYLDKHGISSMQNTGTKTAAVQKRRNNKKKNKQFKSHNDHLSGVLQDYSEKQK